MRRRKVVFAPDARTDLIDLYDWIAEAAGPNTAISYIEQVKAYCNGFDLASERGHRRDDIRPGLRIVGFDRKLTIAFVVGDTTVTILRIFYRGLDWKTELE